jgi:uncharacterized protein (TIGR01777 family)
LAADFPPKPALTPQFANPYAGPNRLTLAVSVGSAMKIVISGASGLVGSALSKAFRAEGHDVFHLVRPGHPLSVNEIRWDPPSALVDVGAIEASDAVIHLSGANIAAGRWTPARKQALRSSRIDSTRVLVDALARLRQKPRLFVAASAVGYYGNRGDEILTETSQPGQDFLSLLARDWEAQTNGATRGGIRTVILRFGVILSPDRGALPQLIRPFRLGVGGRLGCGRQWMSWIALEDVRGIVQFAIANQKLSGPVNAVAPEPVRNAELARIAGRLLHRPAIFPVPACVLHLALGELADKLLLASQRAIPQQLLERNYPFRFSNIQTALQSMLHAK